MPGRWSWNDAFVFIAVITSLQLIMFVLLTKVFFGMLPEGDRCPVCDSDTLAVERKGWRRFFGARFRQSWCIGCGWEGLHRRTDAWMAAYRRDRWSRKRQPPASMTNSRSQSGQLPLNSKKSS
jgi:hypothetical protein